MKVISKDKCWDLVVAGVAMFATLTGMAMFSTTSEKDARSGLAPCGWLERRVENGVPTTLDEARQTYTFFDDDVHPTGLSTQSVKGAELTIRAFERQSRPAYVMWLFDVRQNDTPADYVSGDVTFDSFGIYNPVWVDLGTGEMRRIPAANVVRTAQKALIKGVPLRATPIMIAENDQLPRRTEWEKMSPAEIVDALYRPYQDMRGWVGKRLPVKMSVAQEPWAKMSTEAFLPCFDKFGQFKWREWPGKTHSEEELKAAAVAEEADLAAHPGPADRDRFGGWTKGPKQQATGRFYPKKIDGKWWLVDPDGNLFWSWGAVRVTPSSALTPLNGNPRTPKCGEALPDRDCLFEGLPEKGEELAQFYDTYDALLLPFYLKRGETRRFDFSAANLYRKYGTDWFEKFAESCHRRLRSWGANTIANSSDLRICLQDKTPYAERVEVSSRPIAGSWGQWFKFRDPFDPSFREATLAALAEHAREAHDPWCIGFFIDNEINWGSKHEDLARWTLWSPDDQPAKVEFLKRLAAKGITYKGDVESVPIEELRAFTNVLVEEYFKRTREAVKEFDKGLLYLGCRFARSPSWVIGACAKYCDVVSYNIYTDNVRDWRLPDGLDAPVLIGEFHFGAHDRGLFGAGLLNMETQEGRAEALKTYVNSALHNPQIVGAHWHQFSDQATSGRFDGEHFQVGWTDICDRPYPETVKALREVGWPLYETRSAAQIARAVYGENEILLDCAAGTIEVKRKGAVVVAKTPVDLVVDGKSLFAACSRATITTRRLSGSVATPIYKKDSVSLNAEETFVDFGDWGVRLVARADGVAYRFETKKAGEIIVNAERGGVIIPDAEADCWYAATPEFGCEETVPRKVKASDFALATNEFAYLPFVYTVKGATVAVMDADVRDYPALYLHLPPEKQVAGKPQLASLFEHFPAKTKYAISQWVDQRPFTRGQFVRITEHAPYLTRTKGTRNFPWRVFALAASPAKLCEADIIYALAEPAEKGADFSWVKPGKVAWEWWNNWDNKGKTVGCNTKTYQRFIDFAALNRLEYVILDGGWSDGLDIWKFNPNVDVPRLVKYAAKRGVGIILWMAWAQAYNDEVRVARHFAKLGVKGFKVDFIDRGDAEAMNFMERFAKACAAEKLVIDYHGVSHPTGLQRKYPNILNYEAIHGLEQMKWFKGGYDMVTADVRAFFLRLTAGSMDYTPGAMLNYPVNSSYLGETAGECPGSFGTRARQMAMIALFEAPLQMLCDSPTNYERNAECFRFMAGIPTTWSATVGLGGSPDTVAACARRAKDGTWYAAGIGSSAAQVFNLDTSFLGAGNWTAEIFRDAADSDVEPTHYIRKKCTVTAGEIRSLRLAPGGGFIIKFSADE